MNDLLVLRGILFRLLYLLGGVTFIVITLIPFDLTAGRAAGPDILFALAFLLVIRRPEYLPMISVLFVFFLQEVAASAPLGIWTLLVLLATEWVRYNLQAFREYNFIYEWLWFCAIYLTMMLLRHLALVVTVSHRPDLLDLTLVYLFTILLYPPLTGVAHYVFGVHSPPAGETDAWGRAI